VDAGTAWRYTGILQGSVGEDEASEESHRRALAIFRAAGRADLAAGELSNLAGTLEALGREEEGLELKQEALEFLTNSYGSEHPVVATVRNNIAISLHSRRQYEATEINLASLQLELGETGQAILGYRSALERFESLLGSTHNATARVQSLLGKALHVHGDLEESEGLLRRALEAPVANGAPEFHIEETRRSLEILLRDQGREAEAGALAQMQNP
jgi:tetratricopeptide (TPR) repeat protein